MNWNLSTAINLPINLLSTSKPQNHYHPPPAHHSLGLPHTINRDQAKCKAFSEKKRGEVEDGTAYKTRKEKARNKGLKLEKLIGFKSIDYPEMDVGPLLNIIAQERGHVRLIK